MSLVESSRNSGLAVLSDLPEGGEYLDGEDQEIEAGEQSKKESKAAIKKRLTEWIDNPNIARDVDQQTLSELGQLVCREFDIDEQSRAEWKDEADKALNFATQKTMPKEYPWASASNVIFPLITSAAMRFGAVAYPALVPNRSVVKGAVWGDDDGTAVTQDGTPEGAPKIDAQGQPVWLIPPGAKARRAEKIGGHMSYQLLDEMTYWEEQTDNMLHQIPIVGGGIRKTYRDFRRDCNASESVNLMNLVWSMSARSFEEAPRHTEIQELYPHEIEEFERDDEMFLPQVYGPGDVAANPTSTTTGAPPPDPNDTSAPHTFLEQHRRFDLDGDGYAEPIIVTVHQRSATVVRIVARYEESGLEFNDKTSELKRICPLENYTLYRFLPNPKGGSYPCGFGHYLKPLNEAINTTLNQMFDAGHLQIAGGGFIGTGLSMSSGTTNFSLGEYKPVNTKGGNIRDSIYTMPWPGPNAVLFQLLGLLIGAGKEVASIQDVLTGDTAMANTPPTTMLALVDQGMKVYSAIYKRIFRALKSELSKLYRLNRVYLNEDRRYRVGDTWFTVTPEDYRLGGGVEPVADPTMVSDMQRIMRAALIVDRAKNNPLVNPLAAEKYLFEAAQIPRIKDFLPEAMPPPQPSPEMLNANSKAQEVQLKVQDAASKLGLIRAQEMQAYTAALVNYAKAKATMNDGQIAFMDNQLTMMRLRIEALNTTVKAADVDAKMARDRMHHHATMTGHAVTHHGNLADTRQRAREVADEQPDAGRSDDGGGSPSLPAVSQPASGGDDGSGLSGLAPQPDNAGVPPIPGPTQ